MSRRRALVAAPVCALLAAAALCMPRAYAFAEAASADAVRSKIDARTAGIKALEQEISGYQSRLDELGAKESSLGNALESLDLTQKKLQADIALTKDTIDQKTLALKALERRIGSASSDIADGRRAVADAFKRIREYGDRPFAAVMLSSESLAGALSSADRLARMATGLESSIADLTDAKTRLESAKRQTESARADLLALERQLTDQRTVVVSTKAEQSRLLADTKDSEAAYQRLLAEKQAEKDAFESEILEYESQLKLSVDATKLPPTGTAVLSWPLDYVHITQYFGDTPFATKNAQIYSGRGHNGIDLRASIGTVVKAALTGTVTGIGDTDVIRGCYSLGKWILLEHPDGLSTLYAHLSLQTVRPGEPVATGETIGYSGNTGYTTGPHLHFGVYASSGIEIKRFTDSRHCQNAILPIASLSAYLNPLSYLPALPK